MTIYFYQVEQPKPPVSPTGTVIDVTAQTVEEDSSG